MTVMTTAQLEAQLTSVQAAIAAIEGGGQSYTIDGFEYRRGNLTALYNRETSLIRRINAQSSTARMNRTAATF